ncbi:MULTISPECIES: terminase small subunit [unclassified Devosia]|uniref:terminase small subunit n=1 Tax=unclassified Devosia TaxID=196773 RepID=UPI001AC7601B|nr:MULTISPECIES: terminase small subunit [unclassified Devosia]MBN9306828.1 terminase small subunit [Devosia sp.]
MKAASLRDKLMIMQQKFLIGVRHSCVTRTNALRASYPRNKPEQIDMTPKQERFAAEYIVDLNATEAAKRAGYGPRARVTASELLALPDVQARVAELMRERAERIELDGDRVLAEIMTMAFYDPADYKAVSSAEDIAALPERARRAVVGWGFDRNGLFVFKLADKSKALDQLARHLSLYNDKLEVGGLDALGDRLERARARQLAWRLTVK